MATSTSGDTNTVSTKNQDALHRALTGQKLYWPYWHRLPACKVLMDQTQFAGVPFTFIFYKAMGHVFMDADGNEGLVYRGDVYRESEAVVEQNGRRYGFTEADQQMMLLRGEYKFKGRQGPLGYDDLLIESHNSDRTTFQARLYLSLIHI